MPPRSSLKRVGGLAAYVLMIGQLKMRTLCGKSYGRNTENRGGQPPKIRKAVGEDGYTSYFVKHEKGMMLIVR